MYDLVDEAVVEAPPAEVMAALEDEAAGRSRWWRPWLVMALDEPSRGIVQGAAMTIRISESGHPDRAFGTLRMRALLTEVERGRTIRYALTGPFKGTGEWRFEPLSDVRTSVSLRWRMEPTGLMRLWTRVFDVSRHHSAVMRKGFAGLAAYVAEQRGRAVR